MSIERINLENCIPVRVSLINFRIIYAFASSVLMYSKSVRVFRISI